MEYGARVPVVEFPITCPRCGKVRLTAFKMAAVNDALLGVRPLRLFTICHNQHWNASDAELRQIRRYLGARWAAAGEHAPVEAAIDPVKTTSNIPRL